jgi:hypothetical protein
VEDGATREDDTFCLLWRQFVQLNVMRIRFFRICSPEDSAE